MAKLLITLLFLCSSCFGQGVKSTAPLPNDPNGVKSAEPLPNDSAALSWVSIPHYDEPQSITITPQWCSLQPERKVRPKPYPSEHSVTIFCENKYLMAIAADGTVIDLENAKAGAQPAATGKPATEKPKEVKPEASR